MIGDDFVSGDLPLFKTVPFANDYKVSKNGVVISYRTSKAKILSGSTKGSARRPQLRFTLVNNNGDRDVLLATEIVYRTYVGEIPDGSGVYPIDNDYTNPSLENLELRESSVGNRGKFGKAWRLAMTYSQIVGVDKLIELLVSAIDSTKEIQNDTENS